MRYIKLFDRPQFNTYHLEKSAAVHLFNLSSVSTYFIKDNSVGCANAGTIPTMKLKMVGCEKCVCVNREHQYSVSKQKTKRGYEITFPKQNYTLKAGL